MNDTLSSLIKYHEKRGNNDGDSGCSIYALREIKHEQEARIAELTAEVASLRLGLVSAIDVAESWIHDQLDGTSSLTGALKELDIARNALKDGV